MAAATIPQTMKAFITQADKTGAVVDIPVPSIDDDEVLVQVIAVALNPTDWKFLKNITNPGTICGCDWSGYVVKIGKSVTNFAIGDHAAGFTIGANWSDRGAFAEYMKTPGDLAWKVPAGTVSHEEAATMGCGLWTAIQGLYHPTRLGLVEPPEKVGKEEWVMIYGGSGSVGMFAIQLAHLSGYKVVATASPRNHELCESLGADAVFDYRDPEVSEKIKAATGNALHLAMDAISEDSAQKITIQSFGPGPGKCIVILPPCKEAQALRPDVTLQHTLTYTSQGREFKHGNRIQPASFEDRAHMAGFLPKVSELVGQGKIKPNPVMVVEGGLNGINEGMQIMMDGKNSGAKIVFRVK